jgi:putative transposase
MAGRRCFSQTTTTGSICAKARVACWAYCLMPNHVHLILVPETADGLRAALAKTHRAYAGIINTRRKVTGHFWQGRYNSTPMDEAHVQEALRYVLLNPVKAKRVARADQWPWSSAAAYLKDKDDGLTDVKPLRRQISDMRAFLGAKPDQTRLTTLLAASTVGRPAAGPETMAALEKKTGRTLSPEKRGPKPAKKRKRGS